MRKTAIVLAAAAWLLAAFAVPAAAADIQVTVTEDDPANPLPGSLRHAIDVLAKPGDTIRFPQGHAVDLRAPLVIPPALEGLDISGEATIRSAKGRGVLRIGAHDVTLTLLTLRDVEVQTDVARDAVGVETGVDRFAIQYCTLAGRSAVSLRRATKAVIFVCTFEFIATSGPAPIRLDRCDDVLVGSTVIEGGPRVSLDDSSSDHVTFQNSYFDGDVTVSSIRGSISNVTARGDGGISVLPSDVQTAGGADATLVVEGCSALRLFVKRTGAIVRKNVLGETALGPTPRRPPVLTYVPLSIAPAETRQVASRGEVLVEENVVTGGDIGILLRDGRAPRTARTTLRKNEVWMASRYGIRVINAAQAVLEGNQIMFCGDGPKGVGLLVANPLTDVPTYRDNVIHNTDGVGLVIRCRGYKMIVTGGRVTNSSLAQVVLDSVAGRVTLLDVTVEGQEGESGHEGIRVMPKGNVALGFCTVRGNSGAGVFVDAKATVSVFRGSFERNRGPGIDIAPAGVTPNAAKRTANRNVAWPTDLIVDTETFRLKGVAAPGANVEIWRVEGGPRNGNPANGEGVESLGNVKADAAGQFEFPETGALPCEEGDRLTTTATVGEPGREVTSEFSEDVVCPPTLDWEKVESGTAQNLSAVWVVADDDAWAVGAAGTVRRWNGETWTTVDAGSNQNLTDVVALGPNEVYVAGTTELRKFDGAQWTQVFAKPPTPGFAGWGDAMWGAPGAGLYAAWFSGQSGTIGSRQRFHRLQAGTNTWVYPYFGEGNFGADAMGAPLSYFDGAWGVSATDVWAVTHGGSVYRYDGNSATLDDGNSDEVFVGRFDLVTHLSTFETYDLWAGAGQVFVAGRPPWRFDGTQWSQIPVAAMPPRGTYSVYGAGVGDVSMTMDSGVVIDAFTNAARIDRFDGTSWTTDSVPPLTRPLRRVRGIPGGLRVAVGDAGTILHRKQAVSAAK